MNACAQSLALIERIKATRKQAIDQHDTTLRQRDKI